MHKKFQPLKFLSKEFLSNTPAVGFRVYTLGTCTRSMDCAFHSSHEHLLEPERRDVQVRGSTGESRTVSTSRILTLRIIIEFIIIVEQIPEVIR